MLTDVNKAANRGPVTRFAFDTKPVWRSQLRMDHTLRTYP
jgi:hypothetical protein